MAMTTEGARHDKQRLTVIRSRRRPVSPVLLNLLRDTSNPILAYLAEQHGLRRVPGLSRSGLIDRMLRHLPDDALRRLEDDLIAARYGSLPVGDLLDLALQASARQSGQGKPRLDDMPADVAILIEGGTQRWAYTMHGHDVTIDLARRRLSCTCPYFRFAARRQALCKHLARAFTLIPEAYARETLIDLLISRGYGGPDSPRWQFSTPRAA